MGGGTLQRICGHGYVHIIAGTPLKGRWSKDKSMLEPVHLKVSVAVDKLMLEHLEASVATEKSAPQ